MAAGLLAVVALGGVAGLAPRTAVAATGINHTINFQGKVVNSDGTNVANNTYTFVFKIYTVSSGGSAIWTESKSLVVTDGVFQTNLGDTTSLPGSVDFNTDNIYLGINFNADGEMSPRIQFTSVPQAFNSEKLGGIAASGFAQLSPGSAQSGFLNVTGNVTSGATIAAATSLQAPLVDTASAVALNIGTATASSVTVGRATSSNTVTIQGSNASTWVVTGGSGTTTLAFTAPTATNTITFANAGGTVCTTVATTCSGTYQAVSAGGFLLKNAADTSSANVAGALLGLTNTNTGAGGVLSLSNAGTSSALSVSQSGNPGAGQALIVANAATGVTGSLIDLQLNAVSKFKVDTTGAVTAASTINGQTISSAASFTGTVTVATSVLSPLHATADVASGTSTSLVVRSGNGTAGGASSGNVTIDTGSKNGAGTTGAINLGTTSASSINIGRSAASTSGTSVSIAGLAASSSLIFNDASNTNAVTIGFTTPTAARSILFPDAGGTLCTTTASTCNTTYQAAGSYLLQNPASNQTSTSNFAGFQYAFVQSNTGAGGNLSLSNAGTGSALSVTASGNPSAGNALILANAATGVTGNLVDLQLNSVSKFKVDTTGAATIASTINGQTITSAANFTGTVTAATSFLAPTFDTATGVALNLGATGSPVTTVININQNASVAAGKNITFASGAGNFDQHSSTGTFQSGTGAVSLNGDTTVVGGKNLILASGAGTFSQTNTGTTNDAHTITANSLSTGTALKVVSANNSAANTNWSGISLNPTNAQTTTAVTGQIAGVDIQFTQNPTVAGNNETALNVAVAPNSGSPADSTVASIINVANNDTATGNQITVTDGLKISGANITNGIDLNGTFGTSLITSTNFSVSQAGAVVGVGVNSGSGLLQGTGGLTLTGNTSINGGGASGTITLGGGSAPLTIDSTAFDVTSAGVVSGATGLSSSGTITFSGLTNVGAVYTTTGGVLNSETNLAVTRGGTGIGTTTAYGLIAGGTTATGAFQNTGAGTSGQILKSNGAAALPTWVTNIASNVCSDCLVQVPTTSGQNTIAPTTASVVGLTVKGTTGTAAHVIDIYNSNATPTLQGYFDQNGSLNVGQVIQPTSNNAVDVGLSATAFRTGYFATSVVSPLVMTGDVTTGTSGAVTVRSGNGTAGGASSGNVTIDTGSKNGAGTTGNLYLGTTSASSVNIGRNAASATGTTVSIAGLAASSSLIFNDSTNTNATTITFTVPTANRSIIFPDAGGTVCTTTASTCNTTYAAAGSYLLQNPATNQTSTSSFAGFQYSFVQSSTGAAGNLSLSNAGTGSALSISQSGNPSAGNALILANAATGVTGNLIDLQLNAASKFKVDTTGAVTTTGAINGQTISAAASFTGTVGVTTSVTTPLVQAPASTALTLTGNAASTWSTSAGALTITAAAASTWSTTAGALTVDAAAAVNLGTINATSISIGKSTTTSTINGVAQVGATAGSGSYLNNGSTVNTVYTMSNLTGGGWDAGGAAATVDKYTYIAANQTSSGQTITPATPTASTTYGRLLYLSNIGTQPFTLQLSGTVSSTLNTGSTATLVWANTNGGASWQFAGADGSSILNQNGFDQSANFRITGIGQVNTKVITPAIDAITAGTLSVGTGTATTIQIGSNGATNPAINLDSGTAAIAIGTGAQARTINLGTGAAVVQTINIGGTGANVIGIGNTQTAGTIAIGTAQTSSTTTIGGSGTSATILQAGSGNIQLNAASVTTNQTTAALLNTTATTINAFGVASAINIGASGGTITVGNTGGGSTLRTTAGALTISAAAASTWSTAAGNLTVDSAAALQLGTSAATSLTVGKTGITTTVAGTTQLGAAAGSGALLNNGSTVNSTLAVADDSNGGVLGGTPSGGLTAAQSVDIYTSISVAQTTAGQTITLPTPTASTTYGRLLYFSNVGTASFTFGTTTVSPGTTATLIWSNTNGGASWQFAGADGNGILNQNAADQTANFRISGTGRANTSFTAPLIDAITGGLNVGTVTATSITVGGAANTGGIMLSTNSASSGTTIKSATNSATAFLVQNTIGANILKVDTTDTNLVINPGAEAALGTEWAAYGTNTTVTRTTATAWSGAASLSVAVGTATASVGAKNNLGAALATGTAYTVSFYAKLNSGSFTDIAAAYSRDGTGGTEVACGSYNTQTVVTGGWTRVTCTLTTSGTAGNTSAYLVIRQTASASRTFFLDGVQLEATSNIANAYGAGALQLNAVITSPLSLENVENSTNAFSIQSSAGSTRLFTADTLNDVIRVGSAASSGTQTYPTTAGSGSLFVSSVAEVAGTLYVGNASNGVTFSSGSTNAFEPSLAGTARHQKNIHLTAEYAGAVLDTGGQSSVTGTMTAGFDATQRFGYYKWTTNLASANTYDIVVSIVLPDDWAAWNGNPQFKDYASSIAAGNTIQVVSVTRTDGVADGTFTGTPVNITPGSTSTWATYSSKGLDSANYTAGGTMTIRLRLSSLSSSDIRLGDIILPYFSKY